MTIKGLKAQEIEMELRNVYGDGPLQISAIKKWRTPNLQRRREPGDDKRPGRPAISGLARVIAGFIRDLPHLSCKISCRHLRVSKETYLRFRREKLGSKVSYAMGSTHTL
jgi:hypothetical protein